MPDNKDKESKALDAIIRAAKDLDWVIAFNSEDDESDLDYIIIGKATKVKELIEKLEL